MNRFPEVLFAAPFVVAACLFGGVATADAAGGTAQGGPHGEGDAEARALVLFRLARMDMAAGRFADACPKFEDSQRLDPGVGTMLNLAFCYERLERTASAWKEYQAAAAAARGRGKGDWEAEAQAQAKRLEPFLLRVVIHVEESANGDRPEVMLDEAPFPRSLWDQPTPVDPGRHTVRASAASRQPWSATFDVDSGHVPRVSVPVLDLAPARPLLLAPESRGGWRREASIALGATGLAAAAVGLGFGGATILAHNRAARYCAVSSPLNCNSDGIHELSQMNTDATVSDVAFAIAGASLVGAAVLWFSAPQPSSVPSRGGWTLRPIVDARAVTLSVGEAW
jgi:serine/threonine-protein kinase